ncbi:MAG: cupredoxin domain-containing protein [Acidobacteria bacterium]|nr:cupredoxin domain-containing protein [Acidobacteriota bacterium]
MQTTSKSQLVPLALLLLIGISGATSGITIFKHHAEFSTVPTIVKAGEAAELIFNVINEKGATVRFLEFVHEKPMHLLAVSDDLAEFYHIHPEFTMEDSYNVTHIFPYGGKYKLFADYTPPGSGQIVERFDLQVAGTPRPRVQLVADRNFSKISNGLRITLTADKPLRAGEDVTLNFAVQDSSNGALVTDLQLYLGALAHFVIISEDLQDFIHAHPLDAGEVFNPAAEQFISHVHDPAELSKVLLSPSPSEVKAGTIFPRAGLYKIWAQFKRQNQVITVPFVLDVAAAKPKAFASAAAIPADAIKVVIGATGYEPSRLEVKKGVPIKIAFTRIGGECGGTVVFPSLKLRQQVPVGETTFLELTPQETGELVFTCGMGMYKGMIVVQ